MGHYFNQFGGEPELRLQPFLSGPQAAENVPNEVRLLLDRPGVKYVAVVFDVGLGERVNVFRKMED